ncbi:MAG: hypothetical protein E7067_00065 [Lentimicrobiaceae bacterium]|nr:hypothetical protein [Lentimicrobiaceae bacterium]
MKKKLFLSIMILLFGCSISFAQNDAFFTQTYSEYREESNGEWGVMPILPSQHGGAIDYTAVPVGSGLLLLAGLGLAYGMRKRNK